MGNSGRGRLGGEAGGLAGRPRGEQGPCWAGKTSVSFARRYPQGTVPGTVVVHRRQGGSGAPQGQPGCSPLLALCRTRPAPTAHCPLSGAPAVPPPPGAQAVRRAVEGHLLRLGGGADALLGAGGAAGARGAQAGGRAVAVVVQVGWGRDGTTHGGKTTTCIGGGGIGA